MTAVLFLERRRGAWTVVSASPSVERIAGWPAAAVVGRTCPMFRFTSDDVAAELQECLDGQRALELDAAVLDARELARPIAIELVPSEHPDRAVCLVAPLDARAGAAAEDPLTGLPNRVALQRDLARAIAGARRNGRPVAVLVLDLDGFKAINDRFGHPAGDAVLVEVSHRLRAVTRQEDAVARLGGDEFVVVLTDFDPPVRSRAEAVAEHLRAALCVPMRLGAVEVPVRPSIGVALFPEDDAQADALIARADARMYRDKQASRDATPAIQDLLDRARDARAEARLVVTQRRTARAQR